MPALLAFWYSRFSITADSGGEELSLAIDLALRLGLTPKKEIHTGTSFRRCQRVGNDSQAGSIQLLRLQIINSARDLMFQGRRASLRSQINCDAALL